MWLTEISLQNIRGFASATVSLDRPVTVLVGANGSGKTTLLRAIAAFGGWLQSLYDRRGELPAVSLSEEDVRAGETEAHFVTTARHGSYPFSFRIAWHEANWSGAFVDSSGVSLFAEPGKPYLFMASTDRFGASGELRGLDLDDEDAERVRRQEDAGCVAQRRGYRRFVEWFKEREDIENARRVELRDFSIEDPQLGAVRRAMELVVPGVERIRIQRERNPPSLIAEKSGVPLTFAQLSDGERNVALLVGDIARRAALVGGVGHPATAPFVVLIDEVEQHLHPAWQREIVPLLQKVFPRAQWIVSTHSPQVVASVPADAVLVLHDGAVLGASAPTKGRDTNAILRAIFGVGERPEIEQREVESISALIDAGALEEAKRKLRSLATRLSDEDEAVTRLQTRLDFAEVGL